MKMSYKIAGFFHQIYILLWKNLKLTIRNRASTLIEIFGPLVFLAALVVIRYYVDKIRSYDQVNDLVDIFDAMPIYIRRTRLVYYPPNMFIRGVIENAVAYIQLRQPFFNPRSKYLKLN
jgi:hypothetical protein